MGYWNYFAYSTKLRIQPLEYCRTQLENRIANDSKLTNSYAYYSISFVDICRLEIT